MAEDQGTLGNLVRLAPLSTDDLPGHPDLKDSKEQVTRPGLVAFLRAFLKEGNQFASSFQTHFKKTGSKSSSPSTTPVDVITRDIRAGQISSIPWTGDASNPIPRQKPGKDAGEYWVGRRSYHEDKRAAGTAEWSEFVFGLRDDHSKHEEDFTPTLYDAYNVLHWNEEVSKLGNSEIPGFDTITMGVQEMSHAMPFPVKNRCFPVLVITANVLPSDGFIAITVPVTLSASTTPTSFYTSGRNVHEALDKQKQVKPTFGVYAAVERVRKILPSDTESEDIPGAKERKGKEGQIEWNMATASDAKGNLPMGLQKLGIPGAVVKDVGYFLTWTRKVNPV